MQHNPKAYLFDIIKACDLIIGYTKGFDSTSYLQDRMLRDAVERNFITIGEALNRLKTEDHEMFVQIPDSNKIIAFRNVVVHAYDVIENELVWDGKTGNWWKSRFEHYDTTIKGYSSRASFLQRRGHAKAPNMQKTVEFYKDLRQKLETRASISGLPNRFWPSS